MNKMIVYKISNGGIFVPCDIENNPDLSKVPLEYQAKLRESQWEVYSVQTSKDREVFNEVEEQGYSVQKIVFHFEERFLSI